MEDFNRLLLQTAFSCMACDGDIAKEEIALIEKMAKEQNLFANLNVNANLNLFLKEINEQGKQFLSNYIDSVRNANLSDEDSLKLLDVAVKTIYADEKVEYSEIKFFKLIRSCLTISDEEILKNVEGVDEYIWLAKDVEDPLKSYFDSVEIPQYNAINLNIDFDTSSSN